MTTLTTPLNILFLCTHNSARSILAEGLLNHLNRKTANPCFRGYSAGSSPRENQQPHPLALEALAQAGISVAGLHSKSWDKFAAPDAPPMDLIITVCDNAAGEVCPIWPGRPATAHWGYPDPSEGSAPEAQKREAFRSTLHAIGKRLDILMNLPPEKLQKALLQDAARALAK